MQIAVDRMRKSLAPRRRVYYYQAVQEHSTNKESNMSENNDETKTAPKTHKMLKPAQAIVLRVFAGSSEALTYDQVEAAVGLTGKTGLYSALGGMWNKGVIAHVGGPAPEMSAARVPQAAYDRKETKFQIVSADLRAMLAMLGLAG